MSDGWQDISTAPMDGTPLMLFARCITATAPIILIGWYCQGRWIECSFTRPVGVVPYAWRPMPAFPNLLCDPETEAYPTVMDKPIEAEVVEQLRRHSRSDAANANLAGFMADLADAGAAHVAAASPPLPDTGLQA